MSVINILTAAFLVEAIWETLKLIWDKGKLCLDCIGSLVIGVLISILAKIDIFELQGLVLSIPFIGYILTGILISRGSNFIHDLYGKISLKK
ncbi:putative uncharacterized protein [Clostridium sp. CAG:921]|nr:putative uncharacterized protein [Clostridium sp. CAG:921]